MISVIMPSNISDYQGAAKNRESKFIRAVDSFLNSSIDGKELIIVSDGCVDTIDIYNKKYLKKYNVHLVKIQKQPLFSGNVRQAGIDIAQGDYISFLDSDDYISIGHLGAIQMAFNEYDYDWVYYNDYVFAGISQKFQLRNVSMAKGLAGTSCIAYKRELNISWNGCDGYGHDWKFINRIREKSNNFNKIYGAGYYVCHAKGIGEC